MDINEAFYVAKSTMLAAELPVYDRGCPMHQIDNELGPEEGRYLFHYHVVITGADWSENTILHECTHALQKRVEKPTGYNDGGKEYKNFEPEMQATFVALVAIVDIPITKENYVFFKLMNKEK